MVVNLQKKQAVTYNSFSISWSPKMLCTVYCLTPQSRSFTKLIQARSTWVGLISSCCNSCALKDITNKWQQVIVNHIREDDCLTGQLQCFHFDFRVGCSDLLVIRLGLMKRVETCFYLLLRLKFQMKVVLKSGCRFPLVIAFCLTCVQYIWNWGQRLKYVSTGEQHLATDAFFAEGKCFHLSQACNIQISALCHM